MTGSGKIGVLLQNNCKTHRRVQVMQTEVHYLDGGSKSYFH